MHHKIAFFSSLTYVLSLITVLGDSPESPETATKELSLSIEAGTDKIVNITYPTKLGSTYRLLSITDTSFKDTSFNQKWLSVSNILGTGGIVTNSINTSRSTSAFFAIQEKVNPLYGMNFYVDTNSDAARWVRSADKDDVTNIALMSKIATNPASIWLTGRPNEPDVVRNRISRAQVVGQTPIFILYNIPHRDCGSFSGGGAASPEAYTSWLTSITAAINTNRVVVLLEPDSLANLNCSSLTATQRTERIALIKESILTLKSKTPALVYPDAGHSDWQPSSTMISLLKQVGATNADGFALNVSNFQTDANLIKYGSVISKGLDDMHFIIDTSRNGKGPAPLSDISWCNPPGRALGKMPTSDTGHPLIDLYLWAKLPGESDGNCRTNAPPAGIFWPEYALGLAERAAY